MNTPGVFLIDDNPVDKPVVAIIKPRATPQLGRRTGTISRLRPPIGRNAPCPCGSGKKFKHCHLRKRD